MFIVKSVQDELSKVERKSSNKKHRQSEFAGVSMVQFFDIRIPISPLPLY